MPIKLSSPEPWKKWQRGCCLSLADTVHLLLGCINPGCWTWLLELASRINSNIINKRSEVTWLQPVLNSVKRHEPKCSYAQESIPSLLQHLNLTTHFGRKNNGLPLALCIRVLCTVFPSHERHCTQDLLWGEACIGRRIHSFPYQGKAAQSYFVQSGQMSNFKNTIIQSLEDSCFHHIIISMNAPQPHCDFSQEINPCFLHS